MSIGPSARWSAFICLSLLLSSLLAEAQAPTNLLGSNLTPVVRYELPDEPTSVAILPGLPLDDSQSAASSNAKGHHQGFIVRNLKRGLQDQKSLYLAPFKPKNIKWDIGFLAVTAGLLAADRQVSRDISKDHVDISHSIALAALLGTSATAGGIWAYGLKTGDRHADETGKLIGNTGQHFSDIHADAVHRWPRAARRRHRQWPLPPARQFQHIISRWTSDVHLGNGHRGGT